MRSVFAFSIALLLALFSNLSSAGNTLYQGWGLQPGQGIASNSGEYTLIMQSDGNLVYYRNSDGGVRWHSNTYGAFGAFLTMQGDGNAVAYFDPPSCPPVKKGEVQHCKPDTGRIAIWYSGTGGNPGAYITAQDDGNLEVFSSGGQPIWGIGPDPVKLIPDPAKAGDLVGRDMESDRPYAYLGHLAFYDGSSIFEVLNDGAPNAAAYNSLGAFKVRAPGTKYWGAASPNIPDYFVNGCWNDYCGDKRYQVLNSKMAMALRAFQIMILGADYTYLTQYRRALPRYDTLGGAVRGLYRCDTFVLDVIDDNGNISNSDGTTLNVAAQAEQSPLRRWVKFRSEVRGGLITPLHIFTKMKDFAG